MGLSEREQQLLDDMERRFYQSEADVMQTSGGTPKRWNIRSVVLGILVVLIGVGVLVGGVAAQQLWLGLIGFACMVGGAVLASTRGAADVGDVKTGASGRAAKPTHSSESLSERLNRRWDERMDGER